MKIKFNEEQLKTIINNSVSMAEILRKLGLPVKSYYYKVVNFHIKYYNLNISKLKGKAHLKGTKRKNIKINKRPLGEVLIKNSDYLSTSNLKKRLLNEGLLKDICYNCGITEWLGTKLSLHLDHINGENTDNRLDNLRLLCPNCHSQTSTYTGRNKKSTPKTIIKPRKQKTKIEWPCRSDLESMVNQFGFRGAGKILGVSDNAVRKHLK